MEIKTAIYRDIEVHNKPSFFATPLAWAVASFTRLLIGDGDEIAPHHTGLIVVSDECSLSTIRDLAGTAAGGTISPLRFAGASPSIVAGLPALEHGLRGPTLTFTMPPVHASTAVVALIEYWLTGSNISAIVAITHQKPDATCHLFKGLIAKSAGDELRQHVSQLCQGASRRAD